MIVANKNYSSIYNYVSLLFQHLIWRQQCSILVEFGNSKCLCVDFLDFLINNLQIMAVKLNEKKDPKNITNEDSLDCNSDDVEKWKINLFSKYMCVFNFFSHLRLNL